MSKLEVRRLRLSLLLTLLGCAGWALFALAAMHVGWLSDFWGTAILIGCAAVAGFKMDSHTRKMERRWSI